MSLEAFTPNTLAEPGWHGHNGVGLGLPRYQPLPLAEPRRPALRSGAAEHPAMFRPTSGWMEVLLDQVDQGLFMVDAFCRVLWSNTTAQRQCAALGAALRVGAEGLMARDADDHKRLTHAVAQAASGRRSMLLLGAPVAAEDSETEPMQVDLPDCQASVALMPMPGVPGAVLAVLGRRSPCQALTLQFMAQAYRLTAAETAVLGKLCRGVTPATIAREGEIAVSTVRSQINALRTKTGMRNISGIVRLVNAMPPMLSAVAG